MNKIKQDYNMVPHWLKCTRQMAPDFVVKDPKISPVWEITGAEFSKADIHTADGISIRFPRVTKIRNDKDWKTATSLSQLTQLFETSKQSTDVDLGSVGNSSDDIEDVRTAQSKSNDNEILTSLKKEDEEYIPDEKKPKLEKIRSPMTTPKKGKNMQGSNIDSI